MSATAFGISFYVPGLPQPKGSLRAFTRRGGGVGLEEGNAKKLRPWMSSIAWAAREAGIRDAGVGCVAVSATFDLVRPKCHRSKSGKVKPSAPALPTTKPDVDKLARALLDALTGIAWVDDAQVVRLDVRKRYGDSAGVRVELAEGTR